MWVATMTPSIAQAGFGGGGKDAVKGNDCLVVYDGISEADVVIEGGKSIVANNSDNDGCPANCLIAACTPVAGTVRQVTVSFTPPPGADVAALTLLMNATAAVTPAAGEFRWVLEASDPFTNQVSGVQCSVTLP